MALTFYAGSGSPPTWTVWLVLEHKAISYKLDMLSFQAGDLKKPAFLEKNPRGKVPTIDDDGFALYESSAICEYLDERFPDRPLLPADLRERAVVRRLCAEAQLYVGEASEDFLDMTLYGFRNGTPDEIDDARRELGTELRRWETAFRGDFLAGAALTLADFTLYPRVAMLRRLDQRKPELRAGELIGPNLAAWMKRIEAQPYYDRTYPPHWRT